MINLAGVLRRAARPAAWMGAMLFVAGCTANIVNPRIPPDGGTSDFNTAYVQGCDSGFHDAGWDGWEALYYKDAVTYARSDDYRKGWDLGHNGCYEYGMAHPRPESDHGGGAHGV